VRGIGLLPTTALNAASGCTGFMNAALGFLFFAAFFFAAAILFPPSGNKFISSRYSRGAGSLPTNFLVFSS
jgi:hypothetical protein